MKFFWLIFAIVLAMYVQTQFWTQPCAGDRANWDYMAQVIARGGVPYRDAVNIKSPLSAYIGAAAIVATRPLGLRDILAIRMVFVSLAALTVALTFFVIRDYFCDVRLASLAAIIMLSFHPFVAFNGGVQPKTPMILFGLLTLNAVIKDRPLSAGILGMLSALSWQPGLLFVGVAGLAFSRYLTRWRDRNAMKLIIGAFIPLLFATGYFWIAGALKDLYSWTIDFNARVYAPGEARPPADFFNHLSTVLAGSYLGSRIYFYLAIAGLLTVLWNEARATHLGRHLVEYAPRQAIIVAPIVYFGFCMIDFQGPADLIPLLPFVAAFCAVAMVFVVKREANLMVRFFPRLGRRMVENSTIVAVAAFVFLVAARGLLSTEHPFPRLQDQDNDAAEIASQLGPGDRIFVHGRAEILVLLRLTNASRHFYLDRGKDHYLDKTEQGGFDGWLEGLKAAHPKVVVLDKPAGIDRMKDLEDWVTREYEPRRTRIFEYWVRKADDN